MSVCELELGQRKGGVVKGKGFVFGLGGCRLGFQEKVGGFLEYS